jgi:hypothetical protein
MLQECGVNGKLANVPKTTQVRELPSGAIGSINLLNSRSGALSFASNENVSANILYYATLNFKYITHPYRTEKPFLERLQ